jgi:hypothetical protein
MRSGRLRRFFTFVGATTIAAGALLAIAPGAAHAATPFPAGTTTFHVAGSFSFTVSGTPSPATNFTSSMTGTSDGSGNITFPAGAISIPDVTTSLSGITTIVHLSATNTWTSTIDTTSGAVTLTGGLLAKLDLQTSPPQIGCPLGPLSLHQTSSVSGGKKYTPTGNTATATVGDRTFGVPAVTGAPPTCTLGAVIDGVLGLPIAAGDTSAPTHASC